MPPAQAAFTRARQDKRPSLLMNSVSLEVLSAFHDRKTCCQVLPVRVGLIQTVSVKDSRNSSDVNVSEAGMVTRLLLNANPFPSWPATTVGPPSRVPSFPFPLESGAVSPIISSNVQCATRSAETLPPTMSTSTSRVRHNDATRIISPPSKHDERYHAALTHVSTHLLRDMTLRHSHTRPSQPSVPTNLCNRRI